MKREPALIVGTIVLVLSLLNITLTPDNMGLLEAGVQFAILAAGFLGVRSQVTPVRKDVRRRI